jgi:hypothetical protein
VNAGDEFQFVRVTDVPLSFTASNEFEGPDLDGIGVISALAPIVVDAGDMATLSGDFSDPGDDIVTVNSSIGTVSQDSGAAGGWNLAIDTSTLVPGSYTVVVTADDADGGTATASIELVVRPVDVSVGINIVQDRINLNSVAGSKSRGSNATLTVVVETTGTFDASDIDTSTILFAGASVDRSQLKDVDNDGDLDLVLKFRLRDTNLVDVYAQSLSENGSQPHKRNNRAKVELELTGQTNDGMEIRGSDTASVFMSGKALRKLFESIG